MRGSNSTVLDTVATAGSRSNLFAKLFTQCLQTCECVISSFNVLPNNSTVPFPNACKYHKKSKGHRIVIGWIPWDLFDAFAVWSLVPFVFDAWVVCWSVTPLGTARRKIWSTPVRVPRRLDVCDSVSYCTVVVQDDGCEGSAGLNLPGLKCPLITSGYPARLQSCSSQALWCTGAW